MDVLGLVRQDHRRLEALLERCERTDHDDAEERTVLLAQLDAALRHHIDEEEALLYPAFPLPDRDPLARGTEQHRLITTLADEVAPLLAALGAAPRSGPAGGRGPEGVPR